MAEGRTNAGGGGFNKSVIVVTAPTGSTVTCTKGTTVKTAREKDGVWTFKGLDLGTWTVHAALEGQEASQEVVLERLEVVYLTMAYRSVPDFTYTGDYELVADDDTAIEDPTTWNQNWKLRLLTSGTLIATAVYGLFDVFLVGGGGGSGGRGGGGGGYTLTQTAITLDTNVDYEITIGAGGTAAVGGTTTAFGFTANGGGGMGSGSYIGADGGSGGGGGGGTGSIAGDGGTDGEDGETSSNSNSGGIGQGTTTREFAEEGATLYAGGGGGGGVDSLGSGGEGGGGDGGDATTGGAGATNTGGGGGGTRRGSGSIGGSGIVIIRNARGTV